MKRIDFGRKLVPKEALPLLGKHILFTTPRNYAGALSKLLVERGARAIWMPTIELWPMPDYSELDQAILSLREYDWIAFTSENGIEAFFDRLYARGLNAGALRVTKLAALDADVPALEKRGIKADVVPAESSPQGIKDELVRLGVHSGRILLPVPEVIGVKEPYVVPQFIESLAHIGMVVHRVPAYQTIAVTEGLSLEKRLLLGSEVDLVTFTSSAEVSSLLSLLGGGDKVLERVSIACLGRFTAKTANEAGLRVDILPERYAFSDLLEAIEVHFRT